MEPTPADIASFSTIAAVAAWAGFEDDLASADTVGGSFLDHLGVKPEAAPVAVARISKDAFVAEVANWRLAQNRPTKPAQRASALHFGLACRMAAGTEAAPSAVRAEAEAKAAAPAAALQKACDVVTALLPTLKDHAQHVADERAGKVHLREVVDPRLEGTRPFVSQAVVVACMANYRKQYKTKPPVAESLTIEQVTGLDAVLKSGRTPYLDFAIWGPYGHRLLKQVKLYGECYSPMRGWHMMEVFGPADVRLWKLCYAMLRSGFIQFGAVDLGVLDTYENKFVGLAEKYGPEVWHLLYQAEARTRLECMSRHYTDLLDEGEEAKASGGTVPLPKGWDENRPWNLVWQRATADTEWWKQEVEDPAMMVLAKISSLNAVLDTDALAAGRPGGPPAGPLAAAAAAVGKRPVVVPAGGGQTPPPPTPPVPPQKRRRAERGDGTGRMVHAVADGHYTANRSGVRLCGKFQRGECQQAGGDNLCPSGDGSIHQCSRCLMAGHGAFFSKGVKKECTAAPKPPREKGEGKGKRQRSQF